MKTVVSYFKAGFMLLLFGAFLAGCGGGGGDAPAANNQQTPTVSGVVAAGAPIIGWVYLKDSSGTERGPNNIALDGSFSFDVTGLTAPFFLFADGSIGGERYKLHSVAITPGTANINPLTNLAVAAATGVNDPALVYSDPSAFPAINQANLNKAVADIQNMLKPLLDAYNANINPFTGNYRADHTGLDAVLDVVKVDLNTATGGGVVTVTDKAKNTPIASATLFQIALQMADNVTEGEVPPTSTVEDLKAIATRLSGLATVLNNPNPFTMAAQLIPYFATNYGINNGFNRDQTISGIVLISSNMINMPITSITGLNLRGKNGSGDYLISFTVHFSDGSFFSSDSFVGETVVTKENNAWKFKGNGYQSDGLMMIGASTRKRIKADGAEEVNSGIWFEMAGSSGSGLQFQKAVVTGPGLPDIGITMTKNGTRLNLDPQHVTGNLGNLYVLNNMTISQIPDNAVYTFKIYDADNNLIETRTKTIQRPFTTGVTGELTAGHYPAFGGITSHALSSAPIGSTVNFSYAKPTAYRTSMMYSHLQYLDDSANGAGLDKQLLLDETSGSMTIAAPTTWGPPTEGEFGIAAVSLGREVRVEWEFQ